MDIRTLLVAVALANAFCAGARLLLWRMHPAIPGLSHWASAGAFGVLALALVLLRFSVPWLPTLGLAQICSAAGFLLAWVGFRRFVGRSPLSGPARVLLGAVVVGCLVAAPLAQSLEVRALSNAILIAALSALIAAELFRGPKPLPLALRATALIYAANAAFFLIRLFAADRGLGAAGPLNPDGVAAYTLLWWLGATIAVTLGMIMMTAERLQADLDSQAHRDPLTGALNRRAFSLMAEKAMARSHRYGKPLSVLVMDLDRFKQINDHLGHDGGDTLLCQFVTIAGQILRGEDVFCRFGGEEFVALLPNTSADRALVAAERLRNAFAANSLAIRTTNDASPLPVTVSIGIGELRKEEGIEDLLRRADAALYRAKGTGRNRCALADADPQDQSGTSVTASTNA